MQRSNTNDCSSLQGVGASEFTSSSRGEPSDVSLESLKDDLSFSSTQLDLFNYHHGLLLLHLSASAMMTPSLVAWAQVCFYLCLQAAWFLEVRSGVLFGLTDFSCSSRDQVTEACLPVWTPCCVLA